MAFECGNYWEPDPEWDRYAQGYEVSDVYAAEKRANAWRAMHLDNVQRMIDPCSPLDFLGDSLSLEWSRNCVRARCNIAA